jgi:mitogen-activated protein kinase 1/3
VWSVGCILAELIGRKPIFPGRDSFHQMTLIVNVLGTPNSQELKNTSQSGIQAAALAQAKAAGIPPPPPSTAAVSDEYISALPKKQKVPFKQLYPHSSSLACDLLDRLLVFEPEKRLTVEQALAHPFLDELHCADDEPSCINFPYGDFAWEYGRGISKDDLRYLIHEEIIKHYPEQPFDSNSDAAIATAKKFGLGPKPAKKEGTKAGDAAAGAGAQGGPLNSFANQMAGALPKGGKKTRRKSI